MFNHGSAEFGSEIAEIENNNMALAEKRTNSFQTLDQRKATYEAQGLSRKEVLRRLVNEQGTLYRIVEEIPTLGQEQGN